MLTMKPLTIIFLLAWLYAFAVAAPADLGTPAQKHTVILKSGVDAHSLEDVLAHVFLHNEHEDISKIYSNPAFTGFSATLNEEQLEMLRTHPGVLYAGQVPTGRPHSARVRPARSQATKIQVEPGNSWALSFISSDYQLADSYDTDTKILPPGWKEDPEAWYDADGDPYHSYGFETQFNYTYDPSALGEGVDIYNYDVTIWPGHAEFRGREVLNYGINGTLEWDNEEIEHGTSTAALSAGNHGVARKANLIGVLPDSDPVYAVHQIIEMHEIRKTQPGFKGSIISCQYGYDHKYNRPEWVELLEHVFESAMDRGIHLVTSGGNWIAQPSRDSCQVTPASLGGKKDFPAISVGALNPAGQIADISFTGPCIDIWAPGAEVLVATNPMRPEDVAEEVSVYFTETDHAYMLNEGTSYSAPLVTGIVACAMENATLAASPKLMKEHILANARGATVNVDASMFQQNATLLMARTDVAASAAALREKDVA